MHSPFPGMDPYLEHPALWPDVHNRLITAIADALSPRLAPRYYIGLERRTFVLGPGDIAFIGRPDLSVTSPWPESGSPARYPLAGVDVLEVDVMVDEVDENYLIVYEVMTGKVVTIMELLSPANKLYGEGRRQYEQKRDQILRSYTNLVELDLLRAGKPMPVQGRVPACDYRIFVSRGWRRPRAQLYVFNLRQPIPTFPLPLLPGEEEPPVELGVILHALYERARFDLRLDYTQPPVPPLSEEDAAWASQLLEEKG